MARRSPSGDRLSVSSMALAQGCLRRWAHYKVYKTEKDPDNSTSNALEVGSAFHLVQELLSHDLSNLGVTIKTPIEEQYFLLTKNLKKKCVTHERLNPEDWPLVAALSLGYLHRLKLDIDFSRFVCVDVEREIIDEEYIGYVDVIFKDESKKLYYIADLKTASFKLSAAKEKSLKLNPQLNLYAYYRKNLLKGLDLEGYKFGGCCYLSMIKPKLSKRKTDSDFDFFLRLFEKTKLKTGSNLIIVKAKDLNPEKAKNLHSFLYKITKSVREGSLPAVPNYNYCEQYFKPCPYFSKCYGELP